MKGIFMEARHGDTLTESSSEAAVRAQVTERLVDDLKAVIQRAGEKAVERGKAADKLIRDHPYQTIGIAFGLGLLIGILVRRK
jgi:ElaB/YqjD/DUF883 family membrane-anchored ribosome-binding protein